MSKWRAFLRGMGRVFDLSGSGYRPVEPPRRKTFKDDAEAIRGDWERATEAIQRDWPTGSDPWSDQLSDREKAQRMDEPRPYYDHGNGTEDPHGDD